MENVCRQTILVWGDRQITPSYMKSQFQSPFNILLLKGAWSMMIVKTLFWSVKELYICLFHILFPPVPLVQEWGYPQSFNKYTVHSHTPTIETNLYLKNWFAAMLGYCWFLLHCCGRCLNSGWSRRFKGSLILPYIKSFLKRYCPPKTVPAWAYITLSGSLPSKAVPKGPYDPQDFVRHR